MEQYSRQSGLASVTTAFAFPIWRKVITMTDIAGPSPRTVPVAYLGCGPISKDRYVDV